MFLVSNGGSDPFTVLSMDPTPWEAEGAYSSYVPRGSGLESEPREHHGGDGALWEEILGNMRFTGGLKREEIQSVVIQLSIKLVQVLI